MEVTFDPKPIPGDWNGAGGHTNFSSKSTRQAETGWQVGTAPAAVATPACFHQPARERSVGGVQSSKSWAARAVPLPPCRRSRTRLPSWRSATRCTLRPTARATSAALPVSLAGRVCAGCRVQTSHLCNCRACACLYPSWAGADQQQAPLHEHLPYAGKHETSSIHDFSWGVANRGCSIRVGRMVPVEKCGYYEDRRPASNLDPYVVTRLICESALLM